MAAAKPFISGLSNRESGKLARFRVPVHDVPTERSSADLRADHPALRDGRTLFPSTVVDPADGHRILVDGHNNLKTGRRVVVGPWAGMPIFTITLEERATCPRSCHAWDTCYGNALYMAKRKAYTPDFAKYLNDELFAKAKKHRRGFVVRLHVLGDFPDVRYVEYWWYWLRKIPQLHVWGYTTRERDGAIGTAIDRLNVQFPSRWRVRFSQAANQIQAGSSLGATIIWHAGDDKKIAKSIVCPVERGKAETCGACGLCWFRPADDFTIVFVGHGRKKRSGPVLKAPKAAMRQSKNGSA